MVDAAHVAPAVNVRREGPRHSEGNESRKGKQKDRQANEKTVYFFHDMEI